MDVTVLTHKLLRDRIKMIKISTPLIGLCLLTLGIGIAMTFQTAINSQLRTHLPSALHASLISFTIGTFILSILVFTLQKEPFHWQSLFHLPWYLALGGVLGVYAISMSIYTAPQLGFLTFSGLVLFGQISISMLLDHFGLLNTEKIPITWTRFCGALAILLGVFLMLQR